MDPPPRLSEKAATTSASLMRTISPSPPAGLDGASSGLLGRVPRSAMRSAEANGLVPGGADFLPPPPLAPAETTSDARRGGRDADAEYFAEARARASPTRAGVIVNDIGRVRRVRASREAAAETKDPRGVARAGMRAPALQDAKPPTSRRHARLKNEAPLCCSSRKRVPTLRAVLSQYPLAPWDSRAGRRGARDDERFGSIPRRAGGRDDGVRPRMAAGGHHPRVRGAHPRGVPDGGVRGRPRGASERERRGGS